MTIYVIDTGYGGKSTAVSGDLTDDVGHGTQMINIVLQYAKSRPTAQDSHDYQPPLPRHSLPTAPTKAPLAHGVKVVSLKVALTQSKSKLFEILNRVGSSVTKRDVVLVPWVINRDIEVDREFATLAAKCTVVSAAGNDGAHVAYHSPCIAEGVIAVGCLNKSGAPARISNYGDEVEWMYGTTMKVIGINGETVSTGTSVAAAIYAALLHRAIGTSDPAVYMRRTKAMLGKRFKNELL